jgi:hypothetical protein
MAESVGLDLSAAHDRDPKIISTPNRNAHWNWRNFTHNHTVNCAFMHISQAN